MTKPTLPAISEPASTRALAETAAAVLAKRTEVDRHDVAVVLGSGWRPAADALGVAEHEIPMTGLPGFLEPIVPGQQGVIRSVLVGSCRVLVLLGRTHLYEGQGVDAVAHGVRTAVAAGCRVVVLTNAAGGLRADMRVGQPVLISDHLNFTGCSPLMGPQFVDLTELYSPRLRLLARELDSSLSEGVYAAMHGPHFETPAEIRMLRTLGADLVGMSTAMEAIAAHAAGAEVLGISLVTNLAAGMTGQPLDHIEVLDAGRAAAAELGGLLRELTANAV